MILTGSDFSGVGAFDQALDRLGLKQNKLFACDLDKYARQTYVLNYGRPAYFPTDVNERIIPRPALDIYMTSPPCQGFSIAGQRKGSILFFNSLEFIRANKPRYFIFENVKGLLSHDKINPNSEHGRTFTQWLTLLGGKSVNGCASLFPHEQSVPYHIYYKVLNSKFYGVPQNRERVFIVGIRDDADNFFDWPKREPLIKRLGDVLEPYVDEKYYLDDHILKSFEIHKERHDERGNNFGFEPKTPDQIAGTISAKSGERQTDNYIISAEDRHKIKVKSGKKNGYELAGIGDSINLQNPNSETRRGRVGVGMAQTLDSKCLQGVFIGASRGRYVDNGNKGTKKGLSTQRLEINTSGLSNSLTTVEKDNYVVEPSRIRKLTPRECFRLMDFPESFKWDVSDRQAFKQAGNSIVVSCLSNIIKQLNL